jgi:hypothetical protein
MTHIEALAGGNYTENKSASAVFLFLAASSEDIFQ